MKTVNHMLASLSLDSMGRVILSGELIEQLQNYDDTLFAAGTNYRCGGTANGGCTNTRCEGSVNGSCTNQMHCGSSANAFNCQSPVAELPSNSGCA